jgi:hypothetical protein
MLCCGLCMPLRLSGIKINYFKTKLIHINLRHTEAQTLAVMIDCNLNSFPISYLDIPLHDKELRAKNWQVLLDKTKNKLEN